MESVASSSTSYSNTVSSPQTNRRPPSLPKELLTSILSYLTSKEKHLLSPVSRDFQEAARTELPEWLEELIQLKTDLLRKLAGKEEDPELDPLLSFAEKLRSLLSNGAGTGIEKELSSFRELLLLEETAFTQLTTLFGSDHKLLQEASRFRKQLNDQILREGEANKQIIPLAEKGRLHFAKMFFDLVGPTREWKERLLGIFADALITQGDFETASIITKMISKPPRTSTKSLLRNELVPKIHRCYLATCDLARGNRDLGRVVAQDFPHWQQVQLCDSTMVSYPSYKYVIAPILDALVDLELWEQILDLTTKSSVRQKKFCFEKLFLLCLNTPKKEVFLKSIEFATQLDSEEEKQKAFEAIIATSLDTYKDYEIAEQVMRLLTESREGLEKGMIVLRLAANGESEEVERLWSQFLQTSPRVDYRDDPEKSAAPFRIAFRIFMKKGDKESARKLIKAFTGYGERSEWQIILQDRIREDKKEALIFKKMMRGVDYRSTILEPLLQELINLELWEEASDLAASRKGRTKDFCYKHLFSLCLKSSKKKVFKQSILFAQKLDALRGERQKALEAIILSSIDTHNDFEIAKEVMRLFTKNGEELEKNLHILRLAVNRETQEVEKMWVKFSQPLRITSPLSIARFAPSPEHIGAPFRLASRIFAKQGDKESARKLINAFTNQHERDEWERSLNNTPNQLFHFSHPI